MILELLIYGAVIGSAYAIFAVGLSLMYGVARVANMAYGAFFMLSAYLVFIFLNELRLSLYLTIFLSILLTVIIAIASEKLIVRRILETPNNVFMATIALAFFFEGLIQKYQKDLGYSYAHIPSIAERVDILGVYVSLQWILVIWVFIALTVGLQIFLAKTKIGKAIRAVAQNPDEATAVGILKGSVFTVSMGLSAMMAGVTGVLLGGMQAMSPGMGWPLLVKSLAIVTLGGLGSISGTIIASFILAYAELVVAFISIGQVSLSQFSELISLLLLLTILLIKPVGLFGRKIEEEVMGG